MTILRRASPPAGKHRGCRKITERDLNTTLQRKGHGLPLGREDCVRPEGCGLRVIGSLTEQGERWDHSLGENPRKQDICIRRALDEHNIRLVLRQRRNQ